MKICIATFVLLLAFHASSADVYWQADLQSMDGYNVEYRDGAIGKVSVSGGRLSIEKSNHLGYIVVKPTENIKTDRERNFQCVAQVRTIKAEPECSLGFVRIYGEKENLARNEKLGEKALQTGGIYMDALLYTSEDASQRKLAHYRGNCFIPAILVSGAPSVTLWERWLVEDYDQSVKEWKENRIESVKLPNCDETMIDEEQLKSALAVDIEHTAEIVSENGKSRLLVDGKPTPPVVYKSYGHTSPGKCTFLGKNFEDRNLNLMAVTVRFGDCPARSGVWKGKDSFDTDGAVKIIRDAMRVVPKSYFIITLVLDHYAKFCEDHPEEIWIANDGRKVYGGITHAVYFLEDKLPSQYWYWPSVYSKIWQNEVKKHIGELITALQKEQLDKRIIGMHIAGGHDAQFSTRHVDRSAPALNAFKLYLKQKYETAEQLAAAWKKPNATFETVELPLFGSAHFFNPTSQQSQIDYQMFLKRGPFMVEEDFAEHIRKCFGKKIVILRWCMAAFGGEYGGAYDIDAFLGSKQFDILVAQPSYPRRFSGIANGVRLPLASFHLHNKLYLNEFDLRTYTAMLENEMRSYALGVALNFQQWKTMHHRLAGSMIANNMGYWYYDMAPGWFLDQDIADDIALCSKYMGRSSKSVAQCAFVIDEEGMLLRNLGENWYNYDEKNLVSEQLHLLSASGVPFDILLASDLITNPAQAKKYKLLLLGGMNYFDAPRQKLLKELRLQKCNVVHLAGNGHLGGFKELTGNAWQIKPSPARHMIKANEWGINSKMEEVRYMRFAGEEMIRYYEPDRFSLALDAQSKPLAFFESDNFCAAAMKEYPNGYKEFYIAEQGGISAAAFFKLAKLSGAYTVTDRPGVQVEINEHFLMLHSIIPGNYDITLFNSQKINKTLLPGETVLMQF